MYTPPSLVILCQLLSSWGSCDLLFSKTLSYWQHDTPPHTCSHILLLTPAGTILIAGERPFDRLSLFPLSEADRVALLSHPAKEYEIEGLSLSPPLPFHGLQHPSDFGPGRARR